MKNFSSIHNLFEQQVQKKPNEIAAYFDGQSISYQQLNEQSNQLACYLKNTFEVTSEFLVLVSLERSFDLLVSLLAILKAGGAYVPIDPHLPEKRIQYIIENTQATLLISHEKFYQKLKYIIYNTRCKILNLEAEKFCIMQEPTSNLKNSNSSKDLMYVIYTSGSTGVPKGVMIEHKAIYNRLMWMQKAYPISVEDRVLQKTPFGFDVSVWELFWPLITGAKIVLAKPNGEKDPFYITNIIEQYRITVAHFVPSMLQQFLLSQGINKHTSLNRVICSGEALSFSLQDQFFKKFPNTNLHNFYGPTEAAIDVTAWDCRVSEYQNFVPIGYPIDGVKLYVLDNNLHKTSPGEVGELYISGVCLARGYLNDREKTKAVFSKNPMTEGEKENFSRIYKTGDLVKQNKDGSFTFIGRVDKQVKIRGFRIELGEIECVLEKLPSILQAVAISKKDSSGIDYLVVYVIIDHPYTPSIPMIFSYLKDSLPEYMVPSSIIELEEFPLTSNGKIDKERLRLVKAEAELDNKVKKRTLSKIEAKFYQILSSILETSINNISPDDNFFRVGGHSLSAIQLVIEINRAFGVEWNVSDIFIAPKFEDLVDRLQVSREVKNRREIKPSIIPPKKLKLTPPQKQIYSHQKMAGSDILWFFNEPFSLVFDEEVDVQVLEKALNKFIELYPLWRTRFVNNKGFVAPFTYFKLEQLDVSDLPESQRPREALNKAKVWGKKPFDLEKENLARFLFIRYKKNNSRLLIIVHHLVMDAVSLFSIFVKNLEIIYKAFSEKNQITIEDNTFYYNVFLKNTEKQNLEEDKNKDIIYWKNRLKNLPIVHLPFGKNVSIDSSFIGKQYTSYFSKNLTSKIKKLAKDLQITPFILLFSAFNVLLYRYTNQSDLVVGSIVSGRYDNETLGVLGNFINSIILRNYLTSDLTFMALVQKIYKNIIEDYEHQKTPFHEVIEALDRPNVYSSESPFQIAFVMEPGHPKLNHKWRLNQLDLHLDVSKFPLTFELDEYDNNYFVRAEYRSNIFEEIYIKNMVSHFEELLKSIVANPFQSINTFNLLDQKENNTIVKQWNHSKILNVTEKTVVDFFKEQVESQPNKIALFFKDKSLNYTELDALSDEFSQCLIQCGVKSGSLVALYLQRSINMVAVMLAVLKINAVYLPIDVDTPLDRLKSILSDANPNIFIVDQYIDKKTAEIFCHLDQKYSFLNISNFVSGVPINDCSVVKDSVHNTNETAYLLYTSGSTGEPKGVEVTKVGLSNLLLAMQEIIGLEKADTWLAVTPYFFDISAVEIYLPLIIGASMVLAGDDEKSSPEELKNLLENHPVTIMQATPVTWGFLLEDGWRNRTNIKVLSGGDVLKIEVAKQLLECSDNVYNLYGPTETTIWSTFYKLDKTFHKQNTVPIGKPLLNNTTYILDDRQQPVPMGISGELYIGGLGLAKGYLNKPDLNALKFVPNVFDDGVSAHLYRTGDLVRWLPDGNIEFLGRLDSQVKIRGFRVELEEIEYHLNKHPIVNDVKVVVKKVKLGHPYLIGYIILNKGNKQTDEIPIQLRRFLRSKLPYYMIPEFFIFLENWPLTPNGKVNINNLPKLEEKICIQNRSRFSITFKNETEKRVAKIFEDMLHLKNLNRADDFFELGGHSLILIRIIEQLNKEFDISLCIHDIFEAPTIASLSEKIQLESKKR